MAQENSVSFKCYLQGEGLNEVRRFGVDKDVVCNFSYLKGKLQAVFPSLQGKNISIAWKDSDGDEVIISSDDELIIALTEQQTDVRKLYVTVKPGGAQKEQCDGERRSQHFGVTCDGCNKSVEGYRYKCIQCPDFDLCAVCESKGLHAQHYMIRMPVPTFWRAQFGKRLAHHLKKAAYKAGQMDGDGQCPFNSQGDGKEGHCRFDHHGGHRGHGYHGGKHHKGGKHGGWLETLATYLNDWSLPDDDDDDVIEIMDDGAGPSNNKQKKTSQKEEAHVEYLRTIGKTVANLLDPLGIDVDVEVRTKDKDGNASKTGNEKQSGDKTATEEEATAMEVDDKQDKEKEPHSQSAERELSADCEGWTVLPSQQGDQNPQQQSDAAAAAASTSAQTATTATPTPGVNTGALLNQSPIPCPTASCANVYPNLFPLPIIAQPPLITPPMQQQFPISYVPQVMPAHLRPGLVYQHRLQHPSMRVPPIPTPPTAAPPVPTAESVSVPEPEPYNLNIRPHVAEAVEKMMSMGFSNDGGWLTQLLDSKDGDIIKALDVLQPVKRS